MSYRIGELAKQINVSEHTLRYYEKEGLVVPTRDKNNVRIYSEENKDWATFILHMKETGMSVEDLRAYVKFWGQKEQGVEDLVRLLEKHKEKVQAQLALFEQNLALLNVKLDYYKDSTIQNKSEHLYNTFLNRND